jgi:uncharacterized protein YeaO (DUF488 family)
MEHIIYTSYFGISSSLPKEFCQIAICGKCPDWWTGKWTKILAPKYWFFKKWKEDHDNDFYTKQFYSEVLSPLNPSDIANMLFKISEGKIPCMMCYEKTGDFCHRHIVADWLNKNIVVYNFKCIEYVSSFYNPSLKKEQYHEEKHG